MVPESLTDPNTPTRQNCCSMKLFTSRGLRGLRSSGGTNVMAAASRFSTSTMRSHLSRSSSKGRSGLRPLASVRRTSTARWPRKAWPRRGWSPRTSEPWASTPPSPSPPSGALLVVAFFDHTHIEHPRWKHVWATVRVTFF